MGTGGELSIGYVNTFFNAVKTMPFPPSLPSLTHTPPSQIISILAFSITVGFTGGINDNSLSCNTTSNNASVGVELGFSYPFRENDFRAQYQPSEEVILNISNNTVSCGRAEGFRSKNFAGFAQYFVAMGVLTFLYCLGILLVYVIFINPDLPFAKWLIAFVSENKVPERF